MDPSSGGTGSGNNDDASSAGTNTSQPSPPGNEPAPAHITSPAWVSASNDDARYPSTLVGSTNDSRDDATNGTPLKDSTASNTASGPRHRSPGTARCHNGENTANVDGSTGSTSRRNRAIDPRRNRRSTSASHHSVPEPPGRNPPRATRPRRANPRRAPSTTSTSTPDRADTSADVNGPCVRAYRDTRSVRGSSTGSRNTDGTPDGGSAPRASRNRDTSSTAHQRSTPATGMRTARPAPSKSNNQAGSAPRSTASSVDNGPTSRNRSAVPSRSRTGAATRCNRAPVRATTSGSNNSRRSVPPNRSANNDVSRVNAWARDSAAGASPSYRNAAVYSISNDRANGDARVVSTSTTRIRRARTSANTRVNSGTSNTSRRHSRTVSNTIGKDPYRPATDNRCWDRKRCCHNGIRRSGR